jgi:hypothetical protein
MGVFLAGIGLMFAAVFIPLALFLNGARILLVFVNGLEKANENLQQKLTELGGEPANPRVQSDAAGQADGGDD